MAVCSYIDGWYDPARRHSAIGYMWLIIYEAEVAEPAAEVSSH